MGTVKDQPRAALGDTIDSPAVVRPKWLLEDDAYDVANAGWAW